MKKQELLAVLRLQKVPLVGAITAKKLIAHVQGNVAALFEKDPTTFQNIHGIGKQVLSELQHKKYLIQAQEELNYIEDHNISYHYFLEETYPILLKETIDAPILLFSEGTFDAQARRVISIVGTRNCSNYGRDFCKSLLKDLASYQPIIVSGLAYGIDIQAHQSALANGLQTWAVLAHGFQETYPKSHLKYRNAIRKQGVLFTEYGFKARPQRETFLQRNRIIAGISQATLVIESGSKGGALVTADIANSYDRDVMALPGRSSDYYSVGCNTLLKHHKAHVLTEATDVARLLNWDTPKVPKPKQVPLQQLTIEEELVLRSLSENTSWHLDDIAKVCELSIAQSVTLLLQLELKGLVKPLPGKRYDLC